MQGTAGLGAPLHGWEQGHVTADVDSGMGRPRPAGPHDQQPQPQPQGAPPSQPPRPRPAGIPRRGPAAPAGREDDREGPKTVSFSDADGAHHTIPLHFSTTDAETIVRCCDPFNEKVYELPLHFIEKTAGRETYLFNRTGRRAQVCMKYQQNRCNMKEKCQQIHAECCLISALRELYIGSKKHYVSEITCFEVPAGGGLNEAIDSITFRYSDVEPTDGKERYRMLPEEQRNFILCPTFVSSGECPNGRRCSAIHVSRERYLKAKAQKASKAHSLGGGSGLLPQHQQTHVLGHPPPSDGHLRTSAVGQQQQQPFTTATLVAVSPPVLALRPLSLVPGSNTLHGNTLTLQTTTAACHQPPHSQHTQSKVDVGPSAAPPQQTYAGAGYPGEASHVTVHQGGHMPIQGTSILPPAVPLACPPPPVPTAAPISGWTSSAGAPTVCEVHTVAGPGDVMTSQFPMTQVIHDSNGISQQCVIINEGGSTFDGGHVIQIPPHYELAFSNGSQLTVVPESMVPPTQQVVVQHVVPDSHTLPPQRGDMLDDTVLVGRPQQHHQPVQAVDSERRPLYERVRGLYEGPPPPQPAPAQQPGAQRGGADRAPLFERARRSAGEVVDESGPDGGVVGSP